MSGSSGFLRRFRGDQSGAIAVIAGITLPVLMLAVGVAVDYSNGVRARAKLQAAADAGVLAAAIHLNTHGDDPADKRVAESAAETVLKENLRQSLGQQVASDVDMANFSAEDGVVSFDAGFNNENFFAGIVGADKTRIGIDTEALYSGDGALPVRIALVLDNSLSMRGNRLAQLKNASRKFIQVLEDADKAYEGDDAEVQVGIVPFSTYVNIGTNNRNQPWMAVHGENVRMERRCRQPKKKVSESNCRYERYNHCRNLDGRRSCNSGTRRRCDTKYENNGPRTCRMQRVGHEWKGCILTRYDEDDLQYFGGEKFVGLPRLDCPAPITPLDDDLRDVRKKINKMRAAGNTYMPQGVKWGHILLDGRAPFPIQGESERDLEYLVIMGDGKNTMEREPRNAGRRWHNQKIPAPHVLHVDDNDDSTTADADTRAACALAKRDDIRVMTVALDISPGSEAYKVLQDCASEPGLFYPIKNSKELEDVFEEIAELINRERFKVRVSS